MRVQLQPAYILHQRPYRDSSALLEAFTAEQGRISLVGKGVHRRTRGGSSAALLQAFTPLLLSFSGGGELKTLTHVEAAGGAARLRGERLFSGLYLNELLVRLLHRNDPHPTLFAAYASALQVLPDTAELDAVLRRFELGLLDELGYGFSLREDGRSGEAVRAGAWYALQPDIGLVKITPDGEGLPAAFPGGDLLAMARGEFGGAARHTAKRLMRCALAAHLGTMPLRSRELFRRHSAAAREDE